MSGDNLARILAALPAILWFALLGFVFCSIRETLVPMLNRLAPRPRVACIVPVLMAACSPVPYQAQIGTFGTATANLVAAHAQVLSGDRADQRRLFDMAVKTGRAYPTLAPACASDDPGDRPCVYLPNLSTKAVRRKVVGISPPSPPPLPPLPGGAIAVPLVDTASLFGEVPPECVATEDARALAQAKPEAVTGMALRSGSASPEEPSITEADIFDALTAYAEALKAIASADGRAAMDQATTQLAAAVTQVVSTVGRAAPGLGGAAGSVAGAAVRVAGTIAADVEEYRQFEALRENLIAACTSVRTLGIAAGMLTRAHRDLRREMNNRTMSFPLDKDLPKGFDLPAAYAQGWAAANSSQTLAPDPLTVASRMVRAHDALVVAIARGRDEDVTVIQAIDQFALAAKAFRDALPAGPAPAGGAAGPAKANQG